MTRRSFRFKTTAISFGLLTSLVIAPGGALASKTVSLKLDEAVASTNAFGLELYQKLSDEQPGRNCFVSPLGAALCLNMASCGASGATRAAMERALHEPIANPDSAASCGGLLRAIQSNRQELAMYIANAMLVNKNVPLNTRFAKNVGKAFQSEVRNENFSDSKRITKKINDWCDIETHGRVAGIVDGVKPSSAALLLNAVYFRAPWQNPFASDDTKPGNFVLSDDTVSNVKFMHQTGCFDHIESNDFQAVKLPFKFYRFEAIIFLPKKGLKLDEFRKQFTLKNWNRWIDEFHYENSGELDIPRFHIDCSESLNRSLKAMGMGVIFSGGANFSKICIKPTSLKMTDVLHRTSFDVDEEGVVQEVAAEFSGARTAWSSSQRPYKVIVNRPFVYAIRDTETKALLFIGSVNKPIDPQ